LETPLRLAEALPEPTPQVAAAFTAAGRQLYLVGGAVRDLLLGAGGHDLDFTTDAEPAETRKLLKAAKATAIYDVGERFGTIGGVFGEQKVEVTTYRAEEYDPGSRKPRVEFGSSLQDDLSRRDFTVNAIALDPLTGELVDPFNGQADLQDGLVRAVGDADARLREDPLRLLRAVRFAVQLGFELEPATQAAVARNASSLASISRERVRDEVNKILLSPSPARGTLLLFDLGLMAEVVPELLPIRGMPQEEGRHKDVFTHTLQVMDRTPPRPTLRWAALLHDVAKPRTKRVQNGKVSFHGHDRLGDKMTRKLMEGLRQEKTFSDAVARLVGFHLRANEYRSDWTDGAVRRLVREVGDDLVEDLLALSRADVTSGRVERRLNIAASVAELESRIADLRSREDIAKLDSPLDGLALMALFERGPGPWIKPVKEHLLGLVLDGELAPGDTESAIPIAKRVYEELGLADGEKRR
jgi:poly(A) polymerase